MKNLTLVFLALNSILSLFGQNFPIGQVPLKIVTLPLGSINCSNESWKLVFNDEFNGNQIDPNKWVTYYPYDSGGQCEFCRTHGNEGQIYLDENVVVNGGTLKLVAKKEATTWFCQTRNYNSGMVHSIEPFKFYLGKIEIKGKIPSGMGFWPAFWFYGDNANEIDIFEFGCQNTYKFSTNVHSNYQNTHYDWSNEFNSTTDFSNNFHIYSVEWELNQIIFKVDGNIIRKVPRYWNITGNPLFCGDNVSLPTRIENILMPQNKMNLILNGSVLE